MSSVAEQLAALFDPSEVKFKPQTVKGNRALAVAFVDARVIMDRLDEVLGPENWQDRYEIVEGGKQVQCSLMLRIGTTSDGADRFAGGWITKVDVGGESEQPDGGDRLKSAYSDALKRAAVKFGLGRYLYRLPMQWADFDPVKKQFTTPPSLPSWALPKPNPRPPVTKEPASNAARQLTVPQQQVIAAAAAKKVNLGSLSAHFGVLAVVDLSDQQCAEALERIKNKEVSK